MRRFFILLSLLSISSLHLMAQFQPETDVKNSMNDLTQRLNSKPNGETRIILLLSLSNFYLYNKKNNQSNLDSALKYAIEAKRLSDSKSYLSHHIRASLLYAAALIRKNDSTSLFNLYNHSQGETFIRIGFLIGKSHLEKSSPGKKDFDLAMTYFRKSYERSITDHLPRWRNIYYCYAAEYYDKIGDQQKATATLDTGLNYSRLQRDLYSQTEILKEKAELAPPGEKIKYLKEALEIYIRTGEKDKQILMLKNIADAHFVSGEIYSANLELNEVLKRYNELHYKNLQYVYDLMSSVNNKLGSLDKSLFYALAAVNCAEQTGSDESLGFFYHTVGNVYQSLGKHTESVEWFKRAFVSLQNDHHIFSISLFRELSNELLRTGKPLEALNVLNNSQINFNTSYRKQVRAAILANIFKTLKNYNRAELYYLEEIKWANQPPLTGKFIIDANFDVSEFYFSRGQYDKAKIYLNASLAVNPGTFEASGIAKIHKLFYQVDSAKGDLAPAINHFKIYKAIEDSIFNVKNNRQIKELELKYYNAQQEKDIQSLKNQAKTQISDLQKAALTKNLILVVLAFMMLIIGILLYSYETKRKNNKKLKVKQEEINIQNGFLIGHLKEKDWLVKEIHHRVKNNLQVIMSLLNTQSFYLDNPQALKAIKDSQNRVQSISLIHQKLYRDKNLSSINIESYIKELVQYLIETFENGDNVTFHFEIMPVNVDITQAVPLGLIVNEAITNIMKYAYPNGKPGIVLLSLKDKGQGNCILEIRDYGQGLKAGFDITTTTSLGMDLMQGLSDQLDGSFTISSNSGVIITINFHLKEIQTSTV